MNAYIGLAQDMRTRFATKHAPTPLSEAFLDPSNLAGILYYVKSMATQMHKFADTRVDWDIVYEWVREFASMDHAAAIRMFADLNDANQLFKTSMVDPALARESMVWRWKYELTMKKYNGIDQSMLRRYARNPSVLGRGLPPMKSRSGRGVGTMDPPVSYYQLLSPDADGRVRQQKALALSNWHIDPNVYGAYGFVPQRVER